MIKKQLILSIVSLLLLFSQNISSMEEQRKSKAPRSKMEQGASPKKRQKTTSQEKEINPKENSEFLPIEIPTIIFEEELKRIIQNNSIFNPLDGIKEYLNTLSLVCKTFNQISGYLGWNNKLVGDNKEPKYKIMVKSWFVPKEILEQDIDTLNHHLVLTMKYLDFLAYATYRDPSKKYKLETERQLKLERGCQQAAQQLIAGANSNIRIAQPQNKLLGPLYENQPLLLFVIKSERLNHLVSLLILKRVDVSYKDDKGNNVVLYAAKYRPKILKQLFEYIRSETDDNNLGCYDLCAAVFDRCLETVKILLECGVNPEDSLEELNGSNNSGPKLDMDDLKIAKLLVKYGAEIPTQFRHPLITKGWLKTEKQKQHLKAKKERKFKKRLAEKQN